MDEALQADLGARLAAELERAAGSLEDLAVQLCLDPVVFARHAGPLQRFDQVTQTIGEVARMLRNRGTQEDALTSIRLDSMRQRMTDARP